MLRNLRTDALEDMRVLYVEDDDETREELEFFLKKQVGGVYVASNGRDGLELYQKHKPDIVITDIQMPLISGLSMSADIKQIAPEQRVIIISAYNDVEYVFRAMELGIQHYLPKPVSIERLLTELNKIADQLRLESEILRGRKLLNQYKLMVDEQAIVAKFDQEGHITFANDRFCSITGYSQAELQGNFYPLTYQLDTQAEGFNDFLKELTGQRKWHGTVKNKSKTGEDFVLDITVTAIVNEHDQVEEYVALMVEITEVFNKQELLHIDLKNDLEQQKHLLNEYERALNIGTSLCVIASDGTIINANENFSASLNCQSKDLIGLSFCSLIKGQNSGQGWGQLTQNIEKNIQSTGHNSDFMTFTFKGGPEKTFSTFMVAVYDTQGKIYSYMALCQDITESLKLNDEILDTQKEFIYLMGEVVENRSHETGKHLKRVALISKFLAEKHELSDEFSQMLKITSPMHDIGKIGIPDAILHKAGRLNNKELKTMKTHAELGFNILKAMDMPLVKMAAKIAHEHHEHFDGKGYPNGLKGEQISIEGRIVALVDVFDALGSKRSYKEPWSDKAILSYIQDRKGKQFDPKLVAIFSEHFEEIIAIRNQFTD